MTTYDTVNMPGRDTIADTRYMNQAIRLARRGLGWVEPNPMVGCVIVRDGRVIGQGYHRRFGDEHAEAAALGDCAARGETPGGSDVYVSLEPCTHHAKTPPCTNALIRAGVGRVVIAMPDPFEKVSGRGIEKLRRAGMAVEVGVGGDEAVRLNEAYLKRTATALPWVIAKWAQTLDGGIATPTGDSRWISNEQSRRIVHQLRARVDAIIVGAGTAATDDPMLTARGVPVARVARRVVIDPTLRTSADAKLLQTIDSGHPVTIAVSEQLVVEAPDRVRQLVERGVEIVGLAACANRPDELDWRALLSHLAAARSATNVLVEGGGRTIGSLIAQHMADELLVFTCPILLGDAAARRPAEGLVRPAIGDADRLRLQKVRRVGDDVMLRYKFANVEHD